MNYCYECGSKLILQECFNCGVSEGIVPYCPQCKTFRFPVFSTAVSCVIYNKDYSKILLVKQYGKDKNILVAGYVNKGENLEQTVKREIKEEVGLDVLSLKFNASRYFEKSNSLICNFIVQTAGENFVLNPEVDYAQWYSREDAKEKIIPHGIAQEFLLLSLNKV